MVKARITQFLRRMGYKLTREGADLTADELATYRKVQPFTATSPERVVGLIDAVKYVAANRIEGAIVECGVWRGGSIMTIAYTLQALGDTSRDLYLFDTFEGMAPPTSRDKTRNGTPAQDILATSVRSEDVGNDWCVAGLESVKKNVLSTGYPEHKLHFVKGKVEDTVPMRAPEQIALLRLDTDWYESTRHELIQLYPRVAPNGVLIIDDYGHWVGARQAVDEFFAEQDMAPFLARLDYTGRLAIKPGARPARQ